jgi:hypothetical protein
MTAITVATTDTDTNRAVDTELAAGERTAARVPTWRFGLGTGAIAAVATTVVVVALRAAGVPFDIAGEAIPVLAFAQMVLLGTVIGIVLARRTSASTFVRTTVVLTVLSCIPDVFADTGTATKLSLILTHVVAAAIVIPRLARR